MGAFHFDASKGGQHSIGFDGSEKKIGSAESVFGNALETQREIGYHLQDFGRSGFRHFHAFPGKETTDINRARF